MTNRFKLPLILLFATVLFACRQEKVRQIPVSDFFKTPEKSFLKISPDGKYISYLKPYKEKQNLFIQSLANGKERRATSFADFPVRDYNWTFNNQIVYNQDIFSSEQIRMYVLDAATLKNRLILSQPKTRIRLLNRNRLQKDVITISMNKRDPANSDIYRLNITTGKLSLYIQNPGNITDWYADADGTIRLAKASDGVDETILYRSDEDSKFRPIIVNNFKNSVDPVAFTGVDKKFYALSNVNRDKTALVEINAENGIEERVIYENDKVDILDVGYSKNKHRIEFAAWDAARPQKHFLNNEVESIYNDLSNKLKGNEIRVIDRDTAENKFIVSTYTDRNPGSFYLYEKDSRKLTKISDNNPGIKSSELCAMQPIAYKASDGLLINGYLTLPQNSTGTNLPVIVLPHNGPWNRNNWGYSAEVQFLANRGYAVFQVNYRGSTGYGKAFHSAGFKQVGGKIQQDINDGVKWLIAKKIADPKKIAIMGNGFGGFSALYGVSFHPELYRCAVVQYGLINFFTYIKDAPPFFKPYLKMMYEMVGNPETDADQLRAISPVFHPEKIKAPLLIFQGAKDPRANISELNQFVRELKKRNVAVTYILKENERNIFRSEHSRLQMYTEIEKFLEANMRAKP
jgi:dipeptidyl aminopeptidase/acylaminoacyl peptidase